MAKAKEFGETVEEIEKKHNALEEYVRANVNKLKEDVTQTSHDAGEKLHDVAENTRDKV